MFSSFISGRQIGGAAIFLPCTRVPRSHPPLFDSLADSGDTTLRRRRRDNTREKLTSWLEKRGERKKEREEEEMGTARI